jgi:2-methylcitrate dehydratase PrpD
VTYETRRYPTYPGAFPGGVRIVARDGRSFEAESAHQPGAPENPLPRDAILEKFRRNASLVLAPPAVERLEEALLGLELLDDVRVALAGDERLVAT